MKNSLKGLFLLITFFISGCASTTTSPTVVDNIFISHGIPKLMIQVSDKFPFHSVEKKDYSGTDMHGSLATVGVKTERYIFENYASKRGLVIMIEKFRGTGGRWEMEVPDYSSYPGILVSGSTEMNGKLYSTGIYSKTETYGQFIYKSYGRIFGSGYNIRFVILFFEKLNTLYPTSEFVEAFSQRADKSFSIMPYTATTLTKTSQDNKNNEYLKQNADKTDGTYCRDSLSCAKGYFCKNNICKKAFTD